MPDSSQQHASTKPIVATEEKTPLPAISSSINTDDTHSSSTVLLLDELDYFCDSLLQGDPSLRPVSPLVVHTLERQRRDRQALVQKRRMKQSKDTQTSGHKHRVETVVPVNQKRIRVADTLLFIKEGHVIGEEDLAESVRALHLNNESKEEEEASVDDPPNTPADGPPEDPSHWYHSRRLWAGVAIAAVAVAAVVLVRRKR